MFQNGRAGIGAFVADRLSYTYASDAAMTARINETA